MTTPAPRRVRVGLAAVPALLADALAVLFAEAAVEVHLVAEPVDERFDVAVVTPGLPFPVTAPRQVVLDDGPEASGAATVVHGDVGVLRLADLAEVVRYVRSPELAGDAAAT